MLSRNTSTSNDWSDSDEEDYFTGIETNVLLGIPDGNIGNENDIIDAAVSRIGGLPALLPSKEPSFSSSHCKACAQPMELLVQMWCPFEDSPMDRALYIWGCARSGCQGSDCSVRAWRGLRYNKEYAAKLERERRKMLQRHTENSSNERTQILPPTGTKINPFTMGGNMQHTFINPFGVSTSDQSENKRGSQSDGLLQKTEGANTDADSTDDDGIANDEDTSDTDSDTPLTAFASLNVSDSAWKSAPTYPPVYLSTSSEYLSPQPKQKLPKGLVVEELADDDKKGKEISWAKETYENSLEVDQVFERFTRRVALEGEQCVRYELGGMPLPFGSDKFFDLLWPKPTQEPLPTTKPDFKVIRPQRRHYDPSAVPPCQSCGGARVFECQLMPNLINVLRPSWEEQDEGKRKKMTDAQRRKLVEKALMKGVVDKHEKKGMEWGTCMLFSCSKDCCVEDGKDVREVWREEVVYIQWDT